MGEERSRSLPNAVRIGVGLLVLAGISYGSYRYVTRPRVTGDAVALDLPADQAARYERTLNYYNNFSGRRPAVARPQRAPVSRDVATGISKTGSVLRARRGDAFLRAMRPGANAPYNLMMDYVLSVRESWATPAQWQLSELADSVAANPRLATAIAATAAQKQQLAALPQPYLELTDADRQKLQPLVAAWDSAADNAKLAPAEKLLAAVAEIGAGRLPAVKAAMADRLARIPKILSAQQIEKGLQWRDTPAPPASPAPAP